ncbi:acyl-CoA dehydrogenase family protein [Pseudooceanicola sp. LIPI14-2-Ac024]|uniref:acyl-CoA dehydrogenase family protein n=1 Tax=Pseudooceanicola sp. LIPI14-2-Ac024 TaxID=3344875 RepID=UPI0035D0E1DA
MDFELNDEQRMLSESLTRFLADRYDFEKRKKYVESTEGFDRKIWQGYAEMGLFALPYPEDEGGIGGTPTETMLVAEAMGHAIAVEPWTEAIAIAPALLQAAGADQRAAIAEGIIGGEHVPAWAHLEPGMIERDEGMKTTFHDGKLSGTKTVVSFGAEADVIFVTAVDGSGTTGLYVVRKGAEGFEARSYRTQDEGRAAELTFDGTPAEPLSGGIPAADAIAQAEAKALAASIGEALGIMEQAIDLTVEYIKGREQFGRPIGTFQALQHIAAQAVVEKEQVKSMAMYAALMSDEADAQARDLALSTAKVKMVDAARFVGQMSIQLHGGVGMTMEYAIGHYFKRLTMLEIAWGDRDFHMDRLCEAGGLAA